MAPSVFFLLVLHFLLTMNGATAIPDEELDAMFPALKSSGYIRIGNAIATSDLSLDFLSAATLTLFAPSDASLFALDMELESASYDSFELLTNCPAKIDTIESYGSKLLLGCSDGSLRIYGTNSSTSSPTSDRTPASGFHSLDLCKF